MPRVFRELTVLLTALLFVAGVSTTAMAQDAADERAPAVRMFDNFFVSLVAARLCDNPDERTLNLFTRNMLIVQEVTLRHFEQEMPERTRDGLFEVINNRALALDQSVKGTIAEKGCADPGVIELVHMFDVHARMDLMGEGDAP